MEKPESILEKETNKIICDFELQTVPLIPARRDDLMKVNKNYKKRKKTCCLADFAFPGDESKKTKRERKYLDLTRERKIIVEH